MQAVLSLNGEIIGRGPQVPSGMEQTLTMEVHSNGKRDTIKAGSFYSIVTDAQTITGRELQDAFARVQAAAETVEGADIYTEEYLGALLDYAGKLYLTADNWTDKKELLNVSAEVYGDIESAVSSGKMVIVPADEVSILDWMGSGYMILSMEDYSGTYRITGGLNGESSTQLFGIEVYLVLNLRMRV